MKSNKQLDNASNRSVQGFVVWEIDALPLQLHGSTAERTLALGVILHVTAVRFVASGAGASLVLTLVDLYTVDPGNILAFSFLPGTNAHSCFEFHP